MKPGTNANLFMTLAILSNMFKSISLIHNKMVLSRHHGIQITPFSTLDSKNNENPLPSLTTSNQTSPKIVRMKQIKRAREGLGKQKGYYDERYKLEYHTLSGLPDIHNEKEFLVLGIESSCDDTGVAIVSSTGRILSNIIYSQYEIHSKFGGVVPSLAMESHQNNIDKAINDALETAGLHSINDVDAIAVTKGPGLEICLRVGVRKAQALAREYKKPFVTVHHLEAHCMTARLGGQLILPPIPTNKDIINQDNLSNDHSNNNIATVNTNINTDNTSKTNPIEKIQFPFLTLLVSGGHTSILLCHGLGNYTVLGGTLDDALGEAFEKVARMLGFQSLKSGGAAVEECASRYHHKIYQQYYNENKDNSSSIPLIPPEEIDTYTMMDIIENRLRNNYQCMKLNLPLKDKPNCDFSYAGLKNNFRMALMIIRERLGLDAVSQNAPANHRQEVDEVVTIPDEDTIFLCAGFQDMAFQHVEDRLRRALLAIDKLHLETPINGLVVVGGVAANQELRRRLLKLLQDEYQKREVKYSYHMQKLIDQNLLQITTNIPQKPVKIPLYFPSLSLCTDNGAMVAWAGIEKLKLSISDNIEGLEPIPRWPLGILIDNNEIFRKNT